MASTTTNISIRMDSDLKAQAETLFNEFGMNITMLSTGKELPEKY